MGPAVIPAFKIIGGGSSGGRSGGSKEDNSRGGTREDAHVARSTGNKEAL